MSGEKIPHTRGFDEIVERYNWAVAGVFGVIWRHCQMDRKVCDASHQTMADKLGMTRKTFMKHLQTLMDDGLIVDLTPDLKHKPHSYKVVYQLKFEQENRCVEITHLGEVGVKNFPEGVKKLHTRCEEITHKETSNRQKETNSSNKAVAENFFDPELAEIYQMYESNIGSLSPIVSSDITDIWENTKTPSTENIYLWFEYAIEQACAQNKPRWAYIKAIIESISRSKSLVAHKANGKHKQKNGQEAKSNGSPPATAQETYERYCQSRTPGEALRYARLIDPAFEPSRNVAVA